MKKITNIFILLILLSLIGFIMFFYYIKPQREYIQTSSQECINKAMHPIDNEISKYFSESYRTPSGIEKMLKDQAIKIIECTKSYNTILFSSAERNLIYFNLDLKLEEQAKGIKEYNKRVDDKMKQALIKQKEKEDCLKRKNLYDLYSTCIRQSGTNHYFLSDDKNLCLQKYNYKEIDINKFNCVMMGISTY